MAIVIAIIAISDTEAVADSASSQPQPLRGCGVEWSADASRGPPASFSASPPAPSSAASVC